MRIIAPKAKSKVWGENKNKADLTHAAQMIKILQLICFVYQLYLLKDKVEVTPGRTRSMPNDFTYFDVEVQAVIVGHAKKKQTFCAQL